MGVSSHLEGAGRKETKSREEATSYLSTGSTLEVTVDTLRKRVRYAELCFL